MSKQLISIFAAFLIATLSAHANAWTIHSSFDEGDIGEKADRGVDGFHGAGGLSTYSTTNRLKDKSARIAIKEGSTGYGTWGGEFRFPEKAYKGETIWFLVHTYMPKGFDHYSYGEGNRLKFLRVQTFSESGSNHGYNDLYFDVKGSPNPFKWIYEGAASWVNVGTENDSPQHGKWESYEMAVTLDTVPVSNGGQAKVRIWKNGVLIEEILDKKTLKAESDYSNRALLFTYWNGGAPKDQHMFVDEIVITNEQPSGEDAHGNPHIGGLIDDRPVSP